MSSTYEYATVAQVRAFAQSDEVDAMADATLEQFISYAEDLVNNYAGQTFTADNQLSVRLTGDNSNWLQLPNSPIINVTRVVIDDQEVDSNFINILSGGRIQLSRSASQTVFPDTDVGNVHVDFTYGYSSPPSVVTNATVVISSVLAKGGDNGIVQSQSDGKISISAKVGDDLSQQIRFYMDMVGRGAFSTGLTPSIPERIEINAEQSKFVRNVNR